MLALATVMQRMTAENIGLIMTTAQADKAIGPAMKFEFFETGLLDGKVITSS